jgi:hypothetical protein
MWLAVTRALAVTEWRGCVMLDLKMKVAKIVMVVVIVVMLLGVVTLLRYIVVGWD